MQQPDWKVSEGGGCAQTEPLALLFRGDFGPVQYVSQRSLVGIESSGELYQRIFPNLFPERRHLALTEQTKVEARRQADDQLAVVAPGKRTQV